MLRVRILLIIAVLLMPLTSENKRQSFYQQRSSVDNFKGSSGYYNHFIIDDRVAPGRVWNEEFTSGVR